MAIITVPDGRQTRTFSMESDDRFRKAVSSDGRYLVWGVDGLYRLDLVTGDRETLAAGYGARGTIVTIGPNDEWVAWIAGDPETDDIQTNVCRCRLDGSDFSIVTTADGSKMKPRGEIAWRPHRGQFVVRDGTQNRIGLYTPED